MSELLAASGLLKSALDTYVNACSTIIKSYDPSRGKDAEYRALMDDISRELTIVAGYETEIQATKSALIQCRNLSPTTTLVNTLPPEVLSRIFKLVQDSSHCWIDATNSLKGSNPKPSFPTLPELLSHVCRHWRQTALNTLTLWTHIDITISSKQGVRLLPRAELFIARMGLAQAHLHILIPDHGESRSFPPNRMHLERILSPIAPNMRCLWLDNRATGPNFDWIIKTVLPHAHPGKLTHLVLLDDRELDTQSVIVASDHSGERALDNPVSLEIPDHLLGNILGPIKTLGLCNVLFPPTSQAYAGLVELQFRFKGDEDDAIPVVRLLEILSSCPGLRYLDFGQYLSLDDPQSPVHPVTLTELEVLNLQGLYSVHVALMLECLSPGPKPLQLNLPISFYVRDRPLLQPSIQSFFDRSHVTTLFLSSESGQIGYDIKSHVTLGAILPGLPAGLHTLDLSNLRIDSGTQPCTRRVEQLSTLAMHSCEATLQTLQQLTELCPTQKFRAVDLGIHSNRASREEISKTLASLAPVTDISWRAM